GETGNKVPSFVIPNGANTELFEPGAGGTVTVASPYAIFFGALSRWQGIETLLAAATHDNWPKGVKVAIAGDGAEALRVRQAAGERVIYLGNVPYRELPSQIDNSFTRGQAHV